MRAHDEGFTLVEVLLALTITVILTGVAGTALAVSLKVAGQSDERVLGSRAAQISSLYFASDAQSATSVLLTAPPTCSLPPGGAYVVGFALTSGQVVYFTQDAAAERSLVRRRCTSSGPPNDSVVARSLLTTAAPIVTCSPAACASSSRRIDVQVTARDFVFQLSGSRRVAV